jgi:hypothetical protein
VHCGHQLNPYLMSAGEPIVILQIVDALGSCILIAGCSFWK